MAEPKANRERIGDMLVAAGLVTRGQLEEALRAQQTSGTRLGKQLVSLGYVSELKLAQTLSNQLSIPWVSLERIEFSRDLLSRVSADVAERHVLMPVYVRTLRGQGATLYVAMEDPTDELALQRVGATAGLPVRAMIAAPSDIRRAIDRHYFAEPSALPGSLGGLQEAVQKAAESLQSAATVAEARAPRVPPPPPAIPAKVISPPSEREGLVPVEEYDTPSQPPGGPARTVTFLDGTKVSLPPSGAKRFSQEVSEVRHVVRAIRAASADSGIDEPPTWHAVVKVVLDAAAARGTKLTRKEIAEAWVRLQAQDEPQS